jgi:hypothetical protein
VDAPLDDSGLEAVLVGVFEEIDLCPGEDEGDFVVPLFGREDKLGLFLRDVLAVLVVLVLEAVEDGLLLDFSVSKTEKKKS